MHDIADFGSKIFANETIKIHMQFVFICYFLIDYSTLYLFNKEKSLIILKKSTHSVTKSPKNQVGHLWT